MPVDFIYRWQQLSALVDELSPEEEQFEAINHLLSTTNENKTSEENEFGPKSAKDYVAIVKGGIQKRTRKQKNLIANAVEF